ncbi:hypothetical protein HZF24_03845 [Sedimentibacter hydroxybenzoicus DSM 7310]|uniref:Uncharacterized protein n=1 Tax=Sedimentibacter hydroxybenzoicus DSM 7310 TaxID=1123245 RepID=A0A974GVD7_SEDHY|nr:hypothetical protein [Sedimentibacter hydroxybenzoicus]NYB73267.1 hypothetical protein [Sedimentibacter hydroxybenzoicus DSM 7310]
MLLFRMGPRYLFIRSEKIDEVANFLETSLNGEFTDYKEGMEKSSEYSTLCFITDINHEKTYVEDAKKIVLVNNASTVILSSIINSHACHLVQRLDMGPASIVVRIHSNENKLIDKLKEIFAGKEVDLIGGIGLGEKDDTIISFTDKALSGPVADLLDIKLLIQQPIKEVQERLRLEGLRLVTQSLNDSQWYELRINIYDAADKYKENYDRLMFVFSKLEVGMILGESWTKDYAVMLYFVLTYQVRLFTFFTPQEVKKILMALEYTIDGKRLVDFDLYYKNKKVYWYDINTAKGKKNKPDESKKYRQILYDKLKTEDIKTLELMEKSLVKQ